MMDIRRLRCLAGFPSLPQQNIPCLGMAGQTRIKQNASLLLTVIVFSPNSWNNKAVSED